MGNMSYCRMENTHRDLQDVAEHINDENLSKTDRAHPTFDSRAGNRACYGNSD